MKLSVYQEKVVDEKEIEFRLEKDEEGDVILMAKNKQNGIEESVLFISKKTGKLSLVYITEELGLPRDSCHEIELA